ncbi:MAG: hypothetical protein AB8H80_16555 [Planctomycetota bacterium]
MIRINLLPADLRRGNRLPPRVLAAAFGAALLVSAAVGWFGLVYFGDLADKEQELQRVSVEFTGLKPKVTYHDALVANRKEYELRVQTIQQIGKSRRLWSQFVNELIDVVNNNGVTERHLAWFDSINVKSDPAKGARVVVPANVQGADKSLLANFHEDIEAAPFADELKKKSDPTWKLEIDEERMPPAFLKFPMQMTFQPPKK